MGLAEIFKQSAVARRRLFAVSISYARPGIVTPLAIQASAGETKWDEVDDNGNIVRRQSRDFLLPASELILAGQVTEPQRGDLITEAVGASTQVYEVLPVQDGQYFRYTDLLRQELRIHTQRKT